MSHSWAVKKKVFLYQLTVHSKASDVLNTYSDSKMKITISSFLKRLGRDLALAFYTVLTTDTIRKDFKNEPCSMFSNKIACYVQTRPNITI